MSLEHLRPMIINDPLKDADQFRSAIQRPHGAMCFDLHLPIPLTPDLCGSLPSFPLVSGSIYFDIAVLSGMVVRFTHAAPGTGTRTADVNVAHLAAAGSIRFIINWSPEEILLSVGEPGNPDTWTESKGQKSVESIQVGAGGVIVRLGSEDVQVMGATMYSEGKRVFGPSAIDTWRDTLQAIGFIRRASSDEGFIYEIVSGNLCLAMLVTGYESFCKGRFLELEEEGVRPDYTALINAFTSSAEREKGLSELIELEAQQNGISPTRRMIAKGRIDFQNYPQCKKAFNKAYSLERVMDLRGWGTGVCAA